jgi:hypothetical protein
MGNNLSRHGAARPPQAGPGNPAGGPVSFFLFMMSAKRLS